MLSDLLQASLDGDLNKVTQILAQPSASDFIEQKGTFLLLLLSSPALLCAASLTHPALHLVLRAFLSYLPIAPKDQDGVTPLIAAVKNGHRDVVKALLDHGTPHICTLFI